MRVFVDECINRKLMLHLTGHTFVHIRDTALRGTKNGALLLAVEGSYDVFLTADQNIRHQQNLKKFSLVFVILRAVSTKIEYLLPLVPATLVALDEVAAGNAVAATASRSPAKRQRERRINASCRAAAGTRSVSAPAGVRRAARSITPLF